MKKLFVEGALINGLLVNNQNDLMPLMFVDNSMKYVKITVDRVTVNVFTSLNTLGSNRPLIYPIKFA